MNVKRGPNQAIQ